MDDAADPDPVCSPRAVRSQLVPLAIAVVDALLVALAGLVGGVGMVLDGQWLLVAESLGAAIVFPVVLFVFHWLRLI